MYVKSVGVEIHVPLVFCVHIIPWEKVDMVQVLSSCICDAWKHFLFLFLFYMVVWLLRFCITSFSSSLSQVCCFLYWTARAPPERATNICMYASSSYYTYVAYIFFVYVCIDVYITYTCPLSVFLLPLLHVPFAVFSFKDYLMSMWAMLTCFLLHASREFHVCLGERKKVIPRSPLEYKTCKNKKKKNLFCIARAFFPFFFVLSIVLYIFTINVRFQYSMFERESNPA